MMVLRVILALLVSYSLPAVAAERNEVRIEYMTWVEVDQAIAEGNTTIIIPTGGTEQNGPHMAIGKHNFIVAETARRVAERLSNALVAPVLAYVPEGDIESQAGHMAFAGTISLPEPVFSQVLRAVAASLKVHGFRTIVFLGDSGSSQRVQDELASNLTAEWKPWLGTGVTVLSISDYYSANGGRDWLIAKGETPETIGEHAGIQDTSELLAVLPQAVDLSKASAAGGNGAQGDATRASMGRGTELLEMKVQAAVRQILAGQN